MPGGDDDFSNRHRPPGAELLDRDQFDVEDESCVGADVGSGASFSVGKVGGDEDLVLGSCRHELEDLGPAGDDAVDGEGCGLAALVGAVKFLAVDERAAIVALDTVCGAGLAAGALFLDLVLQSAGESDDAGLGLVGGEKSGTCHFVILSNVLGECGAGQQDADSYQGWSDVPCSLHTDMKT